MKNLAKVKFLVWLLVGLFLAAHLLEAGQISQAGLAVGSLPSESRVFLSRDNASPAVVYAPLVARKQNNGWMIVASLAQPALFLPPLIYMHLPLVVNSP